MKHLFVLSSHLPSFYLARDEGRAAFSRVIHYYAVRLLFYRIKAFSNLLLIQPLLVHIKAQTHTLTVTPADENHIN